MERNLDLAENLPIFGMKIVIILFRTTMNTALRMTKGMLPQLIYALLGPAFFIGFAMLYNPFDIKGYYSFGNLGYGFHLLMLTCIIMLTLLLTRGVFMLVSRKTGLKWWQYAIWCIGEAFIISCFMALYTTLFRTPEANFFQIEADCMKFSFLILVYPYIFLVMWQVISNKEDDILSKDEDTGLVKFYDEHKRLKLTIDGSSVLYISAEFNYISINYIKCFICIRIFRNIKHIINKIFMIIH